MTWLLLGALIISMISQVWLTFYYLTREIEEIKDESEWRDVFKGEGCE